VTDESHRSLVSVEVNGNLVERSIDTRTLLVHFLRNQAGTQSVKVGCDTTSCGACTVLLDGRAVKSCTIFGVQAHGRSITTVEGLGSDGELHPIQEAFHAEHGLQCGYCTAGFIMATLGLLGHNPDPTPQHVRAGLAGNLCRCTGYVNIVRAVRRAARTMANEP
jgi:aerobic carbon-monoxide dehydrogenase small subunit